MPGPTKRHANKPAALETSGAAPEAARRLALRLRQFSFGLLLLGAGVGPLAPAMEATLSLRLIVNLFFLLGGALWLASQALDGRLRLVTGGVGYGLILLVAALLCATVNATYKYPAFLSLLSWVSAAAAFLVVLNECQSRSRRLILFLVVAGAAFVTSLHGLHQIFVELPEARQEFFRNQTGVLRQLNLPSEMAQDFGGRLDKNRVFSTFLIANSFAGFLLLVIPAALGYLADVWRRGERRRCILTGVVLFPIFPAFVATGSKGGAVALAAGLVVFILWGFRDFIARRKMQFACAAAAILVVAGIAQLSGLLNLRKKLGEYAGSSSVRYGYWRGGAMIFEKEPFVGVGLDGFADHYASVKRPGDQEAKRAHNDYLQLLAEGGVILAGAYLFFLASYWRRVARRRGELIRPADTLSAGMPPFLSGVIPLGVGIFLLEMLCGGVLRGAGGFWGWYWPLALGCGWVVFMAVCFEGRGDYALGRSSRATIGIACGLIAFLIHSMGDFNHYVPGTLQTAWILMAILLASRQSEDAGGAPAVERAMGPLARLLCVVLPFAVVLRILYIFIMPVIESNALVESARDWAVERPLAARQRELERAAELNPWDAQIRAYLSDLFAMRWSHGETIARDEGPTLSLAIARAKEAVELDPARSEYRKRLGRLYEARWLQKRDSEDFRCALEAYMKAEELFPSNPETALDYARLLDEAGRYDDARSNYRSAVQLSETLQYHVTRSFTEEQLKELKDRIRELDAAVTEGKTPPPLSFRSPRLRGRPGG